MSNRPPTIDDWMRYVETADTTEGVRRVLRSLRKGHRYNRLLSRPCKELMADLGISERMVGKHMRRAKEDGLIVEVIRPRRGVTAVYEGTFGQSVSQVHARGGKGEPSGGSPRGVLPALTCGFGGSPQYVQLPSPWDSEISDSDPTPSPPLLSLVDELGMPTRESEWAVIGMLSEWGLLEALEHRVPDLMADVPPNVRTLNYERWNSDQRIVAIAMTELGMTPPHVPVKEAWNA